jgi:hypothetical protein
MSAQQGSARKQDENGFLSIKGCPISSYGIFDYSAGQLGLPGDPNRIVKVFRPEEAVNNQETIDSFKDMPFIIDHEMLSGFDDDNTASAPEDYGIDGVLTSNVYYDAPWMRGDIKIFSRKAQRALKNKKDLSLGYSCDFEMRPGVFNGQPYEVVQTNMRGNHIALVDEGRVPGARVLDGRKVIYDHLNFDVVRPSDNEEQHMAKRALDANAVEALKAKAAEFNSALQAFLQEEGTEPEHQANGAGGEGGGSSEGDMTTLNADDPAAGGEGAAAGGEGGGDQLSQLLSQVEQLLASIRQTMGGEGGSDPTADNMNGMADGEGEGSGKTTDEGEANEGEANAEAADGEGEGNVEGLNANGQTKAPEGPSAGKHPHTGDAALRRFYADSASKTRVYDRASKVVGAFDHARMDASQVYAYVLKKLQGDGKLKNVNAADSKIVRVAIDTYLDTLDEAKKLHRSTVQSTVRRTSGDSAVPSDASMDAYLAGGSN